MKRIWTVLSVLALANVVALGGFAGWLAQTGRLSIERLRQVREMFSETVAMEQSRLDAEAQALADAEKAKSKELSGSARSASELVAMRLNATEVDLQRIERLRREVEDLQRMLQRDQASLDEQVVSFRKERDAFNAMRDRMREIEGGVQFKKSLAVLEGVRATEARDMLGTLLQEGSKEQVVSYLNAMDERARAKVLTEFIKAGQPDVAAELLESLRTRGIETPADGETPG
ncbi:MAG: hypothetical protein DYG94_08990 [Leptolyngbya sp. PLA3]|nr:MAG: hypothetical protein EDM82_02805 [Cyanobacteria bacterium CYA]MCE7968866.1 hypothetical protein [Leptolyngbya sp. PL-A3]